MEMKPATAEKRTASMFEKFAVWVQKNAITVFPVSTGCCHSFGALKQEGVEPAFNPHHADVLVVSGTLSNKAAVVVRRIYEQMPVPKYVIAWGGCAISGGLFAESYAVVKASDVVPVDVNIAGCPPDAAAVREGLKKLRRIMETKTAGE